MELIERLDSLFGQPTGGRFKILYGPGIDDTFINTDLHELNLSEALFETLQQRGYERVIFYSPLRSIYFYDARSHALTQPQRLSGIEPVHQTTLQPGPLDDQQLHQPAVLQDANPHRGMGDVHALRLLDAALRQPDGPLTAVIFSQAGTMLQFFDDPRTLAALVGEWAGLPAANRNAVFFLFAADSYEVLAEQAEFFPIPELRSIIRRQGTTAPSWGHLVLIGGPRAGELRRLVRLLRRRQHFAIQAGQLEVLIQRMVTEGRQARYWAGKLADCERLDLDIARRKGWFTAMRHTASSAMEELEQLVGLDSIKQRISEISAWVRLSLQRHQDGDEQPVMHMVFSGSPGTGKTTVARLFGELFWELGLLQRGHLVEVKAADLVAGHVGGTAIKANAVIDRALGGVLFIDEAYTLTSMERGGFGMEAVETLLKRMEDERGRLVVIVAGYPGQMAQFRQANPGLARRFPEENILEFPDLGADELTQVLNAFLEVKGIPVPEPARQGLADLIKEIHRRRDASFGNAGEMRNLAEAIDRRRAARLGKAGLPLAEPLALEDLPARYRRLLPDAPPPPEDVFAQLDTLVGLDEVKIQIRQLAASLEYERLRSRLKLEGVVQPRLQHMVFMGAPGTGKTTVARLLGQLYRALGLLPRGHVVEAVRADLVAGYVGQTALKTLEKVQAALDGVLFIDEAYALVQGAQDSFGKEAVNSLVKAIEENNHRLLVIFAGYPREMQQFLQQNAGLSSRIPLQITFPDFLTDELVEMFETLAAQYGNHVSLECTQELALIFESRRASDGRSFGNGRLVHNVFEQARRSLASRVLPMLRETRPDALSESELAYINTLLPEDLASSAAPIPPIPDSDCYFLPAMLPAAQKPPVQGAS